MIEKLHQDKKEIKDIIVQLCIDMMDRMQYDRIICSGEDMV